MKSKNVTTAGAAARSPGQNIGAALLLGTALLFPAAGFCAENIVHNAGAVTYVSGGVDDASLNALKANVHKYNLKLVFALKSGAYMSDVKVAISDAAGKRVVAVNSDGPWFLAQLPAGNYRVIATNSAGVAITRQVTVDPAKLDTQDFRWASE